MDLPTYKHVNIKSIQMNELIKLLQADINFTNPVALNLKELDLDQQREIIGLIENFFVTSNLSFHYPYPVYLVVDHEKSITQMPTVKTTVELPRFFTQRETKLNIKENYLLAKNKLLQQEIHNTDDQESRKNIQDYSITHKRVFQLEKEKNFYQYLLRRLSKVKRNG